MPQLRYTTPHGITVTRTSSQVPYQRGLKHVLKQLDTTRGAYLSSGYEYPGRYSRWDMATVAPPIEIICRGRKLTISSLNERGKVIVALLAGVLKDHPHWASFEQSEMKLSIALKPLPDRFPEEERSKQPSPFSLLRTLIEEFGNPEDKRLALIGAFGYDLLLQFDPIRMQLAREDHKDIYLLLCDEIYFMDRKKEIIERGGAWRDRLRSPAGRVHAQRGDSARGHAAG
jgi:anthranilate synthase